MEKITFRTLRLKAKFTNEFMAEQLNIKLETYNKYERSERLPPSKRLDRIKELFKCTDEEIIAAYAFHKREQMKKILSNR